MKKIKGDFGKNRILYLMAAPAVLSLLIFSYIPMFGIIMAFQKVNVRKGILKSPFVGLKNFEFLFASTDAWTITRNTICYNVVFIILGMFLSIVLALIMNELTCRNYSKALQTVFIMPHFLSMVVVAMVVYAFLSPANGFVNTILTSTGRTSVNWYGVKQPWPFFLVFIYIWKHTGYSSILYLASISGISHEYYEAAVLDGASRFKQALYVTIPHIRTIVCIRLIMSIGSIFRADFGLFYTVPRNSGFLYPVTDVLDTYVYRALTTLNNPGMATAAGLYQSMVGFILVLIANKIVSSLDSDSAMF